MSQAQLCIKYDPACVECRRDAGKDAAGTTWQCIGHAYLERDRLRAALATAQAERDSAYETVKAVMVRVVSAISQAAIVGKTYDHFVVVGMVETLVTDLRKVESERDAALQRAEQAEAACSRKPDPPGGTMTEQQTMIGTEVTR